MLGNQFQKNAFLSTGRRTFFPVRLSGHHVQDLIRHTYASIEHFLFAVAGMNSDEFDPEALVELGLTYDASRGYSPDFVIHQRYHGFLWEVDWIEEDSFYAWHRDTDPVVKETARSLGKTSRKKLAAICEAGQDPFIPLTLRNLHTHPMLL
jgi:hypothetical protein